MKPRFYLPVFSFVLLFCHSVTQAEWKLEDMIGKDAQGNPIYRAKPLADRFKNPISAADENAFQERARQIIAEQAKIKVPAGNTYFENEKRTYGYLMAQILAGREGAAKDLQLEDAQAKEWHSLTEGIDFYAGFTIKHQTRKYFYFGDLLEPEYRARMLRGAKSWTSVDPMKRPHPTFKAGGQGWGPNEKNSWVDVRSTENLYLMRVSAVYLFAEEAGNKETTAAYKEEIRRYTKALYRVGIGEWDSENYHGHSVGPLCNLYDFSKDDEVRLLAKACLDWFFTAGAVKYYRGAFNGPTKRDYNHAQPFGGSAANMLMVHYGDCPPKKGEWESDEVHMITSAYRPPPAVIQLARKNFPKPVTILASKPPYSATTGGDLQAQPEYLETQHFGNTFLMGSLASGTSEDGGDVNGFKITLFDSQRGAVALQGAPGPDPKHVGSPAYQSGKSAGVNRVAQDGNLAIWLVKNGKAPWCWVLPNSIKVSREKDVTFLEADKTWIALRPLGTSPIERNDELSQAISSEKDPKKKAQYPEHMVLTATGNADKFCGVAVEVGEVETFESFANFKKQVLAAEVDLSKLAEGVVQYKSAAADKKWLGINWNDKASELGVWKNGKRHDWKLHAKYLYAPVTAAKAMSTNAASIEIAGPIYSRWGEGILYVEAGGEAFASSVDDQGQVQFYNGKPADVRAKVPALLKPYETTKRLDVPGLPQGVTVSQDLRPLKPGTDSYTIESDYQQGPVKLEILLPKDYDPKKQYKVLYTLPVNVGVRGPWGCALEELQRRDIHNKQQLICVAPAYDIDPWLGDMSARPASGKPWIRQQSYLREVVIPFIEQRYSTPTTGSERYLLGFSKSALGTLSLFLRYPDEFAAVGLYDNSELNPSDKIFQEWGLVNSYGNREQYEKLSPRTLLTQTTALQGAPPRIVVFTGSDQHAGVQQLRELLTHHRIPFQTRTLAGMKHDWRGDWLESIVQTMLHPDSK